MNGEENDNGALDGGGDDNVGGGDNVVGGENVGAAGGGNNVRRQPRRSEPFETLVAVDPPNFRPYLNEAKKADFQRFIAIKDLSHLTNVNALVDKPKTNHRTKILLLMIMSITRNKTPDQAMQTFGRRGGGGQRGSAGSLTYTRMIRCYDPMCGEVVIIFEGCGHGTAYFSEDPERRDDGTFRK